jgi:PAS domain S-box-containing protein
VTEVRGRGGKPIRVLHVDDEENHLEFTKMFLEALDEEIRVESVSDPLEAIRLHGVNGYDVVLSDYKMISMTGLELLQRVREGSDVPFILYTGRGSEEVAESAFRAGVDDYLKKEANLSHYQVLSKRIRQTVDKHRAEELYQRVVEDSRDGIVILADGGIVFANDAMCRMCGGCLPKGIVGRSLTEFVVETEEEIDRRLASTCNGGENQLFEINLVTSTGEVRTAEVSASRITYLGKPSYLCYLRDITRRRRMEERLEALIGGNKPI